LPVTKAIDKIMLGGNDGSSGNTRILFIIKSKLLTDTSYPCEVQNDN
jgi:hypothetical protein